MFENNVAGAFGGAINSYHSFFNIEYSNFKNNSVLNKVAPGAGGAILSKGNNLIDVSFSIFDGNKAHIGGAIYQETSKMKINQCLFLGNSDSALIGVDYSEMSIENSHFENNVGQRYGGAVSMLNHCGLNVSNTTFDNNEQNPTFDLNVLQTLYRPFHTNATEGGGAAIYLSQSCVGNISKSGFYNNYASFWGGAMHLLGNSSLSVSDTTFENNAAGAFGGAINSYHNFLNIEYSNFRNNSVLNKLMGWGGGLYLAGNCTAKISNVLFSECDATYGGAIVANLTKTMMADTSLISNTGSAIYLIDGVSLDINNCTFINNSTPDSGGAILYMIYCDVKIRKFKF